MIRFAASALLAAGLLVPALPASADDDDYLWGRDRWPQDRRDRDVYSRDRYGYGYGSGSPVQRAMQDLRRVESRSRVAGHNREHFYNAMDRLRTFDERLRREGRWDSGRLDKAIEDLKHLSEADELHPRDRAVMRDSLYALREFRSSRGGGGYYGYGDRSRDRNPWPW